MNQSENLKLFLSNSTSIYYINMDVEGRYIYTNNLFSQIFACSLTKNLFFEKALHPEDVPAYKEAVTECKSQPGTTVTIDIRMPRGDGSLFWTRWEFCALFGENDELIGVQGIGNDITERKRAEIEKQKAQKNLELLMNNTNESFIMVDTDLNILSYNKVADQLIFQAYNVSLKQGLPILMFARAEEYKLHENIYFDALKGNEHEKETSFVGPNNTKRIYANTFKPAYSETGEVLGVVVTSRDITEKKLAEEQLIYRERHFRALIENNTDAIVTVSPEGTITELTPSVEKILGFRADEILHHPKPGLIHPDDLSLVRQTFLDVARRSGNIKTIEFRAKTANNEFKWLSGTFNNLMHEPSIKGLVINFNDVTMRKEAEQALQLSEERYRFLFYVNPQPMWIYDQETLEFLEVNMAAIGHYGYSDEEFRSMTIKEIRPKEDVDMLLERLALVTQNPVLSTEQIWRHKKKNGEIIYVEIKAHSLEYNGRPAAIISVNDLTKKINAEIDLIKSNERFTLAVKATSEAIWEWDIEEDKLYIGDAFETILGWKASPGRKFKEWRNYIHPEDREASLKSFHEALLNPSIEVWQGEYRYLRADGDYSYIADRAWISRDRKRQAVKVVGSLRDMTESKRYEQELLKSNERFELAGKATSDAIWDADLLNDTIHWGEGFETLFGYKVEGPEVAASTWIDHIHPDDRDRVLKTHNDIINSPTGETFWQDEYRFIRNNGTVAHVIDKGLIIRDAKGKAYRIIGAMQDITDRKEYEVKLSRERYLLRTLIDHLPDYIYVKDTSLRHVINNVANVELIGASSEEETLGKTVLDYFDHQTANDYIIKDRELLEKKVAVYNIEEAIVSKNGEKRWLLTTKVPLKDDNENVIGLVGISRDITEHKQIEESLKKSNERYNIVSRATNDAIWDWDLLSGKVVWNDAVKSLFGYTDNEIGEDKSWWEKAIHEQDRTRVVEKIRRYIKEGIENWQDEYRLACADGNYKYVFDRGFILLDHLQRPYRMIGAMMDISQRKKLEEELAAQTIARQRQITEATIQAQEKERSEIGRELHDNINQILTTTKLYIDMAINEHDIREELLEKSYNNISSAIEEIRVLSKSLVPPSLGDIGIKEAIAEMIENLPVAQNLSIRLKTSGFSKMPVSGNIKLMVFRIVQEQLYNIIKHSRATEAEIKLAVSKKMLNITVADNGVGFDLGRKTKGIGLSNITSRAELHHGQVEVHTSPGKGCVLKVSIPIIK
jgi:two-component system, NarL family, sensor histidine kinase UhpB